MPSRINFDVDEETGIKIADIMAATGISTKRHLFEAALDILARVQRLVSENRVVLAVNSSQLDSVLRAVGDGVLIVERPLGTPCRWLVQRPTDWRSTPWIKGTRVHVSDVLALQKADPQVSEQELAHDLNVPLEAIAECTAFARANMGLIEAEDREAGLRSNSREHLEPAAR